ncbi:MAG TPA: ABC transporter permease [Candidatus Limnocylindria bacterium]|nr:ABC transporter permease [Candidatus Limnocylindria bacterium]
MSLRRAGAVARRIVLQFRRDRRSLALLFVAPMVVLTLVGALWGSAGPKTVRVVAAGDVDPQLFEALRGTEMQLTALDRDAALEELKAGRADAMIEFADNAATVTVEGSDPTRTAAIVGRAEAALTHLILDVPLTAFVKVSYLYGGPDYSLLDYLAPVLIALFAYFLIFLLSTVSFLRERTSGTLERLLATPLTRGELVLGYLSGFALFALLQALVILAFTVFVLKVQYRGNLATIFVVEAVLVVGAVSLGLAISAFARNELQAVQFVPLVLLPQVFLSGLLVPIDQLNDALRAISAVLPLTYANEALRSVMVKGYALTDPLILRDIGILAAFALLMALAAVLSIRGEVA